MRTVVLSSTLAVMKLFGFDKKTACGCYLATNDKVQMDGSLVRLLILGSTLIYAALVTLTSLRENILSLFLVRRVCCYWCFGF